VVATTLDVEGHQVHAEAGVLGLEEVVGQFLRHDVVKLLPGLRGQAHQELIQSAGPGDEKTIVKYRLCLKENFAKEGRTSGPGLI